MEITHKDYQNHLVFETLEKYIEFYNSLSFNVFLWQNLGVDAIVNIDTYIFSSLNGTVDSIKILLKNGRVNDGFTLLRKYYDSIITHTYINLYLKNNYSIKSLIVDQINKWKNGSGGLPEFRIMSNYIRKDKKLEELNRIIYKDGNKYKKIRKLANDNTHYTFYENFMMNDNELYLKKRISYLDNMNVSVRELFILHISYIFFLQGHYMMGSDYIDYMDFGSIPPKDSQYWVAPFIQEIFDSMVKVYRPDIAQFIKATTSMHLE